MAATVANVSTLLSSPIATSATTGKLSDRAPATAADGLGGGGVGGEFSKRLDEATGASTARSTPAIVVISRPNRPPKPVRKGPKQQNGVVTPKATASESQDQDGAEATGNDALGGEAAPAAEADTECDLSDETDVTQTPEHAPTGGEGNDVSLAAQSGVAAIAAAANTPVEGVTQPAKVANQQQSGAAAVQQALSDPTAGEACAAYPDAQPAKDQQAIQSGAQETAAAFERSLGTAAGSRTVRVAAVETATPPAQDVPPDVGVKPAKPMSPGAKQPQIQATASEEAQAAPDMNVIAAKSDAKTDDGLADDVEKFSQVTSREALLPQPPAAGRDSRVAASRQPVPPAEARFADVNHGNIVSGVRTTLLPHGGSMQIRLDPPELGALQVMVEMRDGAMTATFQTSNDDATRLLSHSLGQLKTALESQGVTVEKIQVQQAPKDHQATNFEDQSRQHQRDDANARQEQQRREMLRRMWRRIAGGVEPVDLVA